MNLAELLFGPGEAEVAVGARYGAGGAYAQQVDVLGATFMGPPADDIRDIDPPPDADDEVLVHVGHRSWTRADMRARAEDLAAGLLAAGLEPGSAVGVMLPNGRDPVAALFGVWRARGVYVPLNPRLAGDEVDHILTSVDPAVIVTTAELAERFGDRLGSRAVLLAEPAGWSAPAAGAGAAGHRRHEPDVALIQFTSGTTGRPKPVLLLHSGVLTLLDGVLAKLRESSKPAAAAGDRAADVRTAGPPPMPNLIPVSLSLWAGIYNVLFAMRVDAPVVIMDGFDPTEFVTLVRRFAIRSTVLPPAAMAMLSDDPSITDLAPLRFVRSITAPLSPLQARRFHDRFGISVLNGYGQTEIGGEIVGWNAADSREHGRTKLGSVGRPHDGVSLRVVDDDGADVPTGDSGELWVLTPALSGGYADGGDLADRLSPDGWFRTGDFARIDAEGFVWIEGRVSSMINRGGLKVYPGEVEEVIRLHPLVADVAVVGAPDDRLGEVPWAFVVRRDAAAPEADPPVPEADAPVPEADAPVPEADAPVPEADPPVPEAGLASSLESLCREHLAPYKVPAGFQVIAELPRNEVGKVVIRPLIDQIRATS